jgi:SAM-dependent methyltransferase
MALKADWKTYLHTLRREEIETAFRRCPPNLFSRGIELGAGDCYQSTLLMRYVAALTCTEYHPAWIADKRDTPALSYRVCDAETLDRSFAPGTFDIVFSSNVLEHLPALETALRATCRILRDDGIAVHVVPGRFLKVMYLLFFYPNLLLNIGNRLFRTLGLIPAKPPAVPAAAPADFDNNPKVAGHRYRMFWPVPHGAFSGHWEEFRGYGRQRWIAAFQAAGFDVVRVFKGPPLSGYGLGLNTLRRWARNLGVASAHIFVLRKKGCSSPHETYFS